MKVQSILIAPPFMMATALSDTGLMSTSNGYGKLDRKIRECSSCLLLVGTHLTTPADMYGGLNGFSAPWLSLGFEIRTVATILVTSMNTELSAKKRPGHILGTGVNKFY
jgi:hypothetical protein